MALTCSTFNVSRAAYYASQKPRTTSGPVRLPIPPRHASAESVMDAIRKVVGAHAAWGVRKVWATLRRDGLRVGCRRVWALMNANNLVLKPSEPRMTPRRGHVVVASPNRRWATDLTTVWTRREGTVAIVLTVDCGCRSVLDVTTTKSQEAPSVLATVEKALEAEFSSPDNVPDGLELRTDHGSQYTGADARDLATRWGLEHTFAPVGRPTGNAVAERTIRTMKEECLWLDDWDSAEDVDRALQAWRTAFNETRPHQALSWRTPSEERALHLGPPASCTTAGAA